MGKAPSVISDPFLAINTSGKSQSGGRASSGLQESMSLKVQLHLFFDPGDILGKGLGRQQEAALSWKEPWIFSFLTRGPRGLNPPLPNTNCFENKPYRKRKHTESSNSLEPELWEMLGLGPWGGKGALPPPPAPAPKPSPGVVSALQTS